MTVATDPRLAARLAGRLARRMLQSLTRGKFETWMGDACDVLFSLNELHQHNETYQRHLSGLRETVVGWLDTPANLRHYNYDAMVAALYAGSGA